MKRSNELAALLTITKRKLTTKQVAEAMHVSEYAALRALVKLHENGDVERVGVGGVSYWNVSITGIDALNELAGDIIEAITETESLIVAFDALTN